MNARAELLVLLQQHEPADDKEARDVARMRAYAESLADPFSRAETEAHFTASAIVTDQSGQKTCMVYHRKLSRWLQPGGHFEPIDGGSVIHGATREVREETGCEAEPIAIAPIPLDVDIHEIPAHGDAGAHLHLDLRVLLRARTSTLCNESESQGAKWLGWEEAFSIATDPSLSRAFRKARQLLI